MAEENVASDDAQEVEPKFDIGLTPAGFVGINITDASGQKAGYVINNPDEIGRIVVHLQALGTMMIQSIYHQVMQERAMVSEMIQGGGGNLWTP